MGEKNFAPSGIGTPDRLVGSEFLYLLLYPGQTFTHNHENMPVLETFKHLQF
jgi:hypothetical protein